MRVVATTLWLFALWSKADAKINRKTAVAKPQMDVHTRLLKEPKKNDIDTERQGVFIEYKIL
jgi:hypothetical protein